MLKVMTTEDHIERVLSKGYTLCDFCEIKDECRELERLEKEYHIPKEDPCHHGIIDYEGLEELSWNLGND